LKTETKDTVLSQESLANRRTILDIIHRGGASHISSSFSAVEILRAMYRAVDIDKIRSNSEDRDRVIISKGHCAAAVYTVMHDYGLISDEYLESYHTNGSLLSGLVSHFVPYVEHSTGSLGHGLSVGLGVAIGLKARGFDSASVYVIVGDAEMHEGSNWEAFMLAGHVGLGNLCVIIDNNGFGAIGGTDECCSLEPLKDKLESFGFATYEADGHDEDEVYSVIRQSRSAGHPVGIICKTIKGKGVSFMEGDNVWHYRPPNKEAYAKMVLELERL